MQQRLEAFYGFFPVLTLLPALGLPFLFRSLHQEGRFQHQMRTFIGACLYNAGQGFLIVLGIQVLRRGISFFALRVSLRAVLPALIVPFLLYLCLRLLDSGLTLMKLAHKTDRADETGA